MKAKRGAPDDRLQGLVRELTSLLGERCTTAAAERDHHGHGEAYHPTYPPDAVCYAVSTEEVAAIVRLCQKYRVPVVPYGAGTSLEGHVAALRGGICIDVSRMREILAVHPEDLDVTVQAGVTRQQLNAHLRDTGLFFPVDPGADATLGGMAATRASGTNAVRYGTMRDNVLALTVVMSDGTVVRTGSRARKSSAGYDLTRLFVGSEGTLGIITEVTLRLYGIPEAVSAAVCSFPDIESAVRTAIESIQVGVPVARVELLDDLCMRAINAYNGMSYPEAPTLFFEFHGTPRGVEEQAATVGEIAAANGGGDWQWASSAEERNRLWHARHNLHYAQLALRPGAKSWGTDACVPLSQLATCIGDIRPYTEAASFPVTTLGHVGDGNFHLTFIIDTNDPAEIREAEALNVRLVERAIELGGTCTGEHGIGYGKSKFLRAELGEGAVEVMRLLKTALDPHGIMNPGKILPGEPIPIDSPDAA
jgi:D-lactate dehydrogenase (cytochrome)